MNADTVGATGVRFVTEIEKPPRARRALPVRKEPTMGDRCHYCKREGHKTQDCPKYQAYYRKKRKANKGKPASRVPRRRAAPGHPLGFESTVARLRAKRDELDAAIRTLQTVEGLLK